jgi:transcriptional regulator with XRE-family HTH domain
MSAMRDELSWAEQAEPVSRAFAENLRRLMVGATQRAIAEQVGMSRQALNKIMQGKVDPRLSTVQALADVLGKPICQLTGAVDETAALSRDAQRLGLLFDGLDPRERSFLWDFAKRLYGEPPSLP